jgi:nucleotide-binding universal stress UspA family protein
MTMVVGFAPDGRGRAVLHLAAMLARSGGEDVVVSAVVPAPWPPSPAKIDAEYQSYLQGAAENALSRARGRLPADIPATYEVLHARSAPAGLLDVAERDDASLIVVGSSADGGSGMVSVA